MRQSSVAQRHYGVDDVVVVLLERLDGLCARHAGLLHHELDVLVLEPILVHLLVVVVVLLGRLLRLAQVDGLALAAAVVVARVVGVLGRELLGGGRGSLRVEVFNFRFAEDSITTSVPLTVPKSFRLHLHPSVARGRLVHIRVVDNKQDLFAESSEIASEGSQPTHAFGSSECDAGNAIDMLQAQLGNGLPGLFLVARVDGNGGTGRDGGLAALNLDLRLLRRGGSVFDLSGLPRLVRQLLNARA
jgi:hypothetical protein